MAIECATLMRDHGPRAITLYNPDTSFYGVCLAAAVSGRLRWRIADFYEAANSSSSLSCSI
ncbi:hypothetical protein OUZ56_030115 [Daphnia magna]|uniref:Uncharacterized protein n=1 Tax=Daphnia magna TaxID=35525 RepID=A0ABQ9ZQB9_9CRUS|nr:hypothetical protein OUZ56_030115 [Daphnia magna]